MLTREVRDKMWQEMGRLNRLITANTSDVTPVDAFYIEKQLSSVYDDPDLHNLLEANFQAAMATSHGLCDMNKFVKVWSGIKAIHQKYSDDILDDMEKCGQMIADYDAVYELSEDGTKLDKFISADLRLTSNILNALASVRN